MCQLYSSCTTSIEPNQSKDHSTHRRKDIFISFSPGPRYRKHVGGGTRKGLLLFIPKGRKDGPARACSLFLLPVFLSAICLACLWSPPGWLSVETKICLPPSFPGHCYFGRGITARVCVVGLERGGVFTEINYLLRWFRVLSSCLRVFVDLEWECFSCVH